VIPAFATGIYLTAYLPYLPQSSWLPLLLPVLLFVGYQCRSLSVKILLAAILGSVWLITFVQWFAPQVLPAELEGQAINVTGIIKSIPENRRKRSRFDFQILNVDGSAWKADVRLNWYSPESSLSAGQVWRMAIKLKRPHGFSNPGGFDYEGWLFERGIAATGYVRHAHQAVLLEQRATLNYLRQLLSERLLLLLQSEDVSGLLVALVTGDRQYLSASHWQALQRTGTTHLMAISGLHIGLIFALFYWIGKQIWCCLPQLCLYRPAQDVAMVSGLLAAIVYAALAGFSIPTQRALIMLAVIVLSLLLRRAVAPLSVLLVALLAVLLIDPLSILNVGFWLSYAAVTIIYFALTDRIGEGVSGKIRRLAWLQIALAIGLMPLTLIFFHQFSLVAPLVNMFAVPWVGMLIVPMLVLLVVIQFVFHGLADYVADAVEFLMMLLWGFIQMLAETEYAVMRLSAPTSYNLITALPGLIILYRFRGRSFAIAGLLFFTPWSAFIENSLGRGELQVDFLDVGQGLAVVARTHGHVLLYDTGFRAGNHFDIGRRVILPYLWREGITHIDRVILSHDDKDHTGGYQAVADEIMVHSLTVMPNSEFKDQHAHSQVCQAGQRWRWDGVDFDILYPTARVRNNQGLSSNNRSCVVRIRHKEKTIMLTGDIEARAEQEMVAVYGKRLKSHIISAPHHGSATSSTQSWLHNVLPEYVVYSMDYRNRFGFPREDVIQRYRKLSTRQLRNDKSGMVRFVFYADGSMDMPYEYRRQWRRFWHYMPAGDK